MNELTDGVSWNGIIVGFIVSYLLGWLWLYITSTFDITFSSRLHIAQLLRQSLLQSTQSNGQWGTLVFSSDGRNTEKLIESLTFAYGNPMLFFAMPA